MATRSSQQYSTTWLLCSVIFICFSLTFLMGSQVELLATSQWVLSEHQTTYMPIFTPVTITLILWGVAWGLRHVALCHPAAVALNFAPSLGLLALLTCYNLPVADGKTNGFSWVEYIIAFALIFVAMTISRRMTVADNNARSKSTMRNIMVNTALMLLLIICTAWAGNTRAHIHNTLQMSRLCSEERYDDILQVGATSPECNRSMCAMRAYALSQQELLGERLFTYPQHHGALGLVPPLADSAYIVNWPALLSRHLRARYYKDVETSQEAIHYLRRALELNPGRVQADYLLCAYLLERRLDDFADELVKHYELNDSLPKHYREALAVYQRRVTEPAFSYHNAETEGLLAELLACKTKYPDKTEQEFHIVDMYHETYWCYYYYPSHEDK